MTDNFDADDMRYMAIALNLAGEAGERGEVPVGAVAVSGGVVIGRGANSVITTSDPTAHAEICALRQAAMARGNYRVADTTLYVTLEPCPMCAGAMVHARIERLVFGAPDPRAGAAGTVYEIARDHRLNHRIEVVGGVRGGEAGQLLKSFFSQRRQTAGGVPETPDAEGAL